MSVHLNILSAMDVSASQRKLTADIKRIRTQEHLVETNVNKLNKYNQTVVISIDDVWCFEICEALEAKGYIVFGQSTYQESSSKVSECHSITVSLPKKRI